MPTILGVNFGREFWGGGGPQSSKNKAEKITEKLRHQNSLRNLPAFFLKFAGPRTNNPKSALQNLGHKTCATKTLPNFRANFLARFASKPLFYWLVPPSSSENSLALFRIAQSGFAAIWVASACADCPGCLVLGAAPAPASTFVSEPQIVPLT